MDTKKMVLEFLKSHRMAVMATVNTYSSPEAAVVGYTIKDNFEMHIATFDSSRKYLNIKKNSKVALVIGWEAGKTVQLEGEAEEITDLDAKDQVKWEDYPHMPTLAKYIKQERAVFLKITPKWLKYSDFSTEPWQIEELRFI